MSYDLRLWTVRAPELPRALPTSVSWVESDGAFVHEARKWQIVVSGPSRVEPEDVPEEAAALVPGIGFLCEVNLEPIHAPKSARTLATKTARAMAKAAHGVVVDPQEDSVTTPAGVKRFVTAKRPDRFSTIEMNWWFTGGPLLTRAGLDAFVDCLARYLPDALPKRYGLHEPPQHRLADTGVGHFREFLAEHADDFLVWYPHRPVMGVNVHTERAWGVGRQGFRCGYCSVAVEHSALVQPGWQDALRVLWTRLSHVVRPFYGDVRTLGGFVPAGATYGIDMRTDFHPVRGPFWRGVPRDPGHACVAGPEYLRLWPGFRDAASMDGEFGFVTTDDWASGDSVVDATGPVPPEIALAWTPEWTEQELGGWSVNWNTKYPPRWPFGDPPPADE